ncbi:MAG: hypothetical protein HY835_00035, partial [Anaerolineae bacterium]|nr:hypothetical protein [Anaerolineae bacterium]
LLAACAPAQVVTPQPTIVPEPTATAAPSPTLAPTATLPQQPATETPNLQPQGSLQVKNLRFDRLEMLDAMTGWAIGVQQPGGDPDVLLTQDGGETWQAVTPPLAERAGSQAVAYFLDASHAWVVFVPQPNPGLNRATVWRTSDGGLTWSKSEINGSSLMMDSFATAQISFSGTGFGWALAHLGAGMNHDYVAILTTRDGGQSWQFVVEPEKNNLWMSCQKNDVWFRTPQNGFVAGTCNGVMAGLYWYVTADGGETWTEASLPAPTEMPDAFTRESVFCEGDHLRFDTPDLGRVLVRCTDMDSGQASRWLYTTLDGGGQWTPVALPAPQGEISFAGQSGWYLVPAAEDQPVGAQVFSSSDGGTTWAKVSDVDWTGSIDFVDSLHGWALVKGVLYRSADGGVTWTMMN